MSRIVSLRLRLVNGLLRLGIGLRLVIGRVIWLVVGLIGLLLVCLRSVLLGL